jgi:hypothetical protein
VFGVGEAALVDDQAGVDLARRDRRHDAVVADLDLLDALGCEQAQQQLGRGGPAGHGDPAPAQALRRAGGTVGPGDDQRAHAAAQRAAGAQHPPCAGEPAEGVVADLGDVELACERTLVERLDVVEHDLEAQRRRDAAVHQRVEDEAVVGARREAEAEGVVRGRRPRAPGYGAATGTNVGPAGTARRAGAAGAHGRGSSGLLHSDAALHAAAEAVACGASTRR